MQLDIGNMTHRGELRLNEPMARHTSWQVGGAADYYYQAAGCQDLLHFLRQLPRGVPLLCLGRGSNLLVRDGGVRGVVVAMGRSMAALSLLPGGLILAEAGAHCARAARFAAGCGLGGAEFLAGVPGSIGGALAMNAGAWGQALWDLVQEVSLFDRGGHLSTHPASEFQACYRELKGVRGRWFFSCRLKLARRGREQCRREMRRLLLQRARQQPLRQPSCGSVFKNPPGDYAARLIERCGLKGSRVGAARVSDQHGNFIINEGGATACDIEQLMQRVQEQVQRRCGVLLQPEVRIIGEAAERNHAG